MIWHAWKETWGYWLLVALQVVASAVWAPRDTELTGMGILIALAITVSFSGMAAIAYNPPAPPLDEVLWCPHCDCGEKVDRYWLVLGQPDHVRCPQCRCVFQFRDDLDDPNMPI